MSAQSKSVQTTLAASSSSNLKLAFPTQKQKSRGHNASTLEVISPASYITTPGQNIEKARAQSRPTLSIKLLPPQTTPESPPKSYLAVSIDVDAPFPSFPLLSPALHSMQTDLKPSSETDGDGWTELVSDVCPIAFWAPPAPPPISAPHRYVFMVWEQPDGVDEETIRKGMGLRGKVGLMQRVKWDQSGFEAKFGLEKLVGGTYFVCG
ncbi:PEBP-like protein [Periconia macrospinosa]|uniref:PEBP-like protein n=1 Tax=Periconia macrospinosa TaxID=97972 RepID=A0A2V1E7W2_9PLEO|nr:PEBP-like protein [Periconia macrospinosa]